MFGAAVRGGGRAVPDSVRRAAVRVRDLGAARDRHFGQQRALLVKAALIGLVVNLSVNLYAIPRIGANGAALATVIGELVSMVMLIGGSWPRCGRRDAAAAHALFVLLFVRSPSSIRAAAGTRTHASIWCAPSRTITRSASIPTRSTPATRRCTRSLLFGQGAGARVRGHADACVVRPLLQGVRRRSRNVRRARVPVVLVHGVHGGPPHGAGRRGVSSRCARSLAPARAARCSRRSPSGSRRRCGRSRRSFMGHAMAAAGLLFAFAAAMRIGPDPARDLRLGAIVGLAAGWATVVGIPGRDSGDAARAADGCPRVAARTRTRRADPRRAGCLRARVRGRADGYQWACFGSPFHIAYSSEQGFDGMRQGILRRADAAHDPAAAHSFRRVSRAAAARAGARARADWIRADDDPLQGGRRRGAPAGRDFGHASQSTACSGVRVRHRRVLHPAERQLQLLGGRLVVRAPARDAGHSVPLHRARVPMDRRARRGPLARRRVLRVTARRSP